MPLPAADEIQQLDPVAVSANRYTRPLLYCEVAGFQILSPFTEAQTKFYARGLQLQRVLLSVVIPEEFQAQYDAPQPMLLDDKAPRNAQKIYDAMRTKERNLENDYDDNGRVERELSRLHRDRQLTGKTYFVPTDVVLQSLDAARNRPEIFEQPDSATSSRKARGPSPDGIAFYTDLYGIDAFSPLLGDNVGLRHAFPLPALLEHRRPRLPEWTEHLLGGRQDMGVFTTMYINSDKLGISPAQFTVAPVPWPTVERAFAEPSPTAPHSETARRNEFLHVFATWALVDGSAARTKAFWKFVQQATVEPVSDAMFSRCFGVEGWKQLQRFWKDRGVVNLFAGSSNVLADQFFRLPKECKLEEPQVRLATRAETVRIRCEYEWRIGREFEQADPELARQCFEQAGRRLHKAYAEGERDPRFLAVLALFECDAGDPANARQYVEQAAATQVTRPSLYYEQARFRYADERAKLPTADSKLDAEQTRRVLAPLALARTQRPALNETYQLTAEIWARSAALPSSEDLAVLSEGVRLFPRDPILAYKAALLHARAGAKGEASTLATQGLRFADGGSDLQTRLLKLQQPTRGTTPLPLPTP